MKHLILAVVALLATAQTWATEHRFPITLSGTVQTTTGNSSLTDQNLVSAPGNHLVMMIDLVAHAVAIEEWNAQLTAQVNRDPSLSGDQSLMENYRMAVVGTTKLTLMANLEMVAVDWNHDGTPDHDGSLQLVAQAATDKVTGAITKLSGTLIGVLNDSVNGVALTGDMQFRGKFATSGPELGTGPSRNSGTPGH